MEPERIEVPTRKNDNSSNCANNLPSIQESCETEHNAGNGKQSSRPDGDIGSLNGHDPASVPETKKSDVYPYSVEDDSDVNQPLAMRLPVGRTVSVGEYSENGDGREGRELVLEQLDKLTYSGDVGRFETETSLQIFPIDPAVKNPTTSKISAASISPIAAAKLTLKKPIANLSNAVLSKNRVSPEMSILMTPAKRAIRAELQSKGKLKRQRLKKVHFQLPKSAHRRTSVHSLNPNMQFVQRWLMFMVLPLSYEVWAFPYRLALGYPTLNPHDSYSTFVSDALCDAAFALDMLISLITAIPVPDRDEFVTSFADISWHYFIRTFPYQVLPSAAFWVATSFCAREFAAVCPERFRRGLPGVKSSGNGSETSESADTRWHCIVDSQHWSVWVWWACTVPRLVPRFLRLRSYFKSMERNLVTSTSFRRNCSILIMLRNCH
jgi:hypothetical protein